MSKTRGVLSRFAAILVFVAVLASAVLAAGCSVETGTLESIAVTEAKTQYFIGDDFDGNIKVTARYLLSDGTTRDSEVNGFEIDSSAYKKDVAGDYEIKVSFKDETGSAETSYTVNVTVKRNGLALSFKQGAGDPVRLSSSNPTADISAAASWIEVRQPDEKGEVSDNSPVLDSDYYTVKVFKGKEEITDLSGVKRGAYQIWASRYDADDDFTYEGFILFYVVDEVKNIALKSGTVEQERSLKDKMSSTWKFTVTYASGDSIEVDKTDMYLDIPAINTNAGNTNQNFKAKVTVTYNEPLPNGTAQSKSVSVGYTLIGKKAVPDMAVLNPDNLKVDEDSGSGEVKTDYLTFEILGIKAKSSIVNKGGTIEFPTSLEIEPLSIEKAWQSGGASSLSAGGYINFKTDRNFEIYVFAHSNGKNENERYINFETEDEYSLINSIENYYGFGSDNCVGGSGNITCHAQSVTGVPSEGVEFSLSFSGSINVVYILIVFEDK